MAGPRRLGKLQLLLMWEVRGWAGPTGWVSDHLSSGVSAGKRQLPSKQLPSSAMGWRVRCEFPVT